MGGGDKFNRLKEKQFKNLQCKFHGDRVTEPKLYVYTSVGLKSRE